MRQKLQAMTIWLRRSAVKQEESVILLYQRILKKQRKKPLKYEGVEASSETVLDGSYGLQRPFMFVTRASGDFESEEKEQLVAAFLDYLQNSAEGMAVVQKAGGEVDLSKPLHGKN